jgi:hypothetical protein
MTSVGGLQHLIADRSDKDHARARIERAVDGPSVNIRPEICFAVDRSRFSFTQRNVWAPDDRNTRMKTAVYQRRRRHLGHIDIIRNAHGIHTACTARWRRRDSLSIDPISDRQNSSVHALLGLNELPLSLLRCLWCDAQNHANRLRSFNRLLCDVQSRTHAARWYRLQRISCQRQRHTITRSPTTRPNDGQRRQRRASSLF